MNLLDDERAGVGDAAWKERALRAEELVVKLGGCTLGCVYLPDLWEEVKPYYDAAVERDRLRES